MEIVALDPSLTLYLKKKNKTSAWALSSIKAGRDRRQPLGEDEIDGHSRPGIEALCLLTLLTYISRSKKPNQPDQIPDEFVTSLKILFDAKRKILTKWQDYVFGSKPYLHNDDPFPRPTEFLQAFKVKNTKRARIRKEITVNVLTEVESGEPRKLKPAELDELCRQLARVPSQRTRETSVKIQFDDGSYISSAKPSGALSNTSRFSLIIEANPDASLCILWLGGDTSKKIGTNCLYPHPREQFIHKMRRASGDDDIERKILKITAEHQIEIVASAGVETCLVLEKKEQFSKADTEKIATVLSTIWSDRPKALPDNKPRFNPVKIERPALPTMGIRPASAPKEWHQKIAVLLSGMAEKAHIFEVPYKS